MPFLWQGWANQLSEVWFHDLRYYIYKGTLSRFIYYISRQSGDRIETVKCSFYINLLVLGTGTSDVKGILTRSDAHSIRNDSLRRLVSTKFYIMCKVCIEFLEIPTIIQTELH